MHKLETRVNSRNLQQVCNNNWFRRHYIYRCIEPLLFILPTLVKGKGLKSIFKRFNIIYIFKKCFLARVVGLRPATWSTMLLVSLSYLVISWLFWQCQRDKNICSSSTDHSIPISCNIFLDGFLYCSQNSTIIGTIITLLIFHNQAISFLRKLRLSIFSLSFLTGCKSKGHAPSTIEHMWVILSVNTKSSHLCYRSWSVWVGKYQTNLLVSKSLTRLAWV